MVSETQAQADKLVSDVGDQMLKIGMERSVSKYGTSRGWKTNLLKTSNGFTLASYGIRGTTRGLKEEFGRPDWFIIDDIDGLEDSPKTVAKKIRALTQTILPAGSPDCAILFVQNLVHEDSIMATLADGSADFLLDRIMSEIEPAVRGLVYSRETLPGGRAVFRITDGVPTWSGQSLRVCEEQLNTWGERAFLREAQQQVYGGAGYFFNPDEMLLVEPDELPEFKAIARAWDLAATQDGGDYTAGIKTGVTRGGVYYVLDISRAQLSPDNVKKRLLAKAQEDKAEHHNHRVRLRLAIDPGQAGEAQAIDLGNHLKGFDPNFVHIPRMSKAGRAEGFANEVNIGNYRIVRHPDDPEYDQVINDFRKELRKFREDGEHDHDDMCDAGTDSYLELNEPPKKTSGVGVGASLNVGAETYQAPKHARGPAPESVIIGEGYDPLNAKV